MVGVTFCGEFVVVVCGSMSAQVAFQVFLVGHLVFDSLDFGHDVVARIQLDDLGAKLLHNRQLRGRLATQIAQCVIDLSIFMISGISFVLQVKCNVINLNYKKITF